MMTGQRSNATTEPAPPSGTGCIREIVQELAMADQDRRVRRTRRTLHEALIALILERGYERVTVQDILDRADVGRSTFYAHYRDKEALLLTSFDDVRDELRREFDATPQGQPAADPARP